MTTLDKSAARVRRMFAEISRRYDLLNHLLSLGIDRRWRRRTTRLVVPHGEGPVLDVCAGTGDLSLAYWRAGRKRTKVVGADFCRPMLEIGKRKACRAGAAEGIALVEADTLHLPFPGNTFQIVCVAFGLRNVSDTQGGLREMARVCRPGGHLAVLEFSMPVAWPLNSLYRAYFHRVLPCVGQVLARNRQGAYNYLPESVGEFPQGEALLEIMRKCGLSDVRQHSFTFGIATLYVGKK